MALENFTSILAAAFGVAVLVQLGTYAYNIFLHPLRKYPGPKICAASQLPIVYKTLTGRFVKWATALHEEYDSGVIRTGPNELSFSDARAWKDIYGHRKTGQQNLIKSDHFYRAPFDDEADHIINSDDVNHSRMRRVFSNAFSDRALKEQEPLFLYYVNLLMKNFEDQLAKDPDHKFDMVKQYNYCTFDVMADLTFGESLHLLDDPNSEFIPWVAGMFASLKFGSMLHSIRYFPTFEKLLLKCVPKSLDDKRREHQHNSSARVDKRLAKKTAKPDIWNLVLNRDEATALTVPEMHSNANLFMFAGTETTATLLSGLTFYLLKNPDKMKKLTDEIRGSVEKVTDMTLDKLAQMKYLHACLEEGLRMYPPVPNGLQRTVPPGGAEIAGDHVPPGSTVYALHFAQYRNPKNFRDPYEFIPERWISDEYASDVKSALQPFSVGPRNCIGKNLAYHEMRVILATTLFNYDLSLCSECENWADQKTFVLWSKSELLCKVKPVQR